MAGLDALLVVAVCSALWGSITSVIISGELQKRGEKLNFFLFRALVPRYVHRYKELTQQESGRPGWLFYSFVISMNLALLLVVIWIVARAL